MEPYPIGTVVDYHGGHAHGRYVITEHQEPEFTPEEVTALAEQTGLPLTYHYPDGVAYSIWKEGVLQKFGNRMYMISRVRRESITPIGDVK